MSDDGTNESKLTTTKRLWAATGRFLTGQAAERGEARLPPGQHLVANWPVLDLGLKPELPLERWRLEVGGMVEHPLDLDWAALNAMPQSRFVTDIHCVTTWSRYDNEWQGVSTRDLMATAAPRPGASHVLLTAYDGYTTNLPLDDFLAEDAILAHSWQGQPLSRDHGAPLRLVVPHLYFWKSAKWLKRIDLAVRDAAGYWERNGYHMLGDPWREQRYSDD